MRSAHRTAVSIAIILVCLSGISRASVVTVDIASKSATSDVATLDPAEVQVVEGQVGVYVKNTTRDAQQFILRATGLTAQSYDVYANGQRLGTKTAEELATGISATVDGRAANAQMIRCLEATHVRIADALKRLQTFRDPESQRVCNTLNQAVGWIAASSMADRNWRSVWVVLSPTGKALLRMGSDSRKDKDETADTVIRACWLLQQARSRMSSVIKYPELRNGAVSALTPVDFTAVYTIRKTKPHLDASLTNNCDLPITGMISLSLPKGWKCTTKSLNVSVKPGQTLRLSFDLIAASKTAIAPDSVPIAANVTLVQGVYTAGLKLKVTADKR